MSDKSVYVSVCVGVFQVCVCVCNPGALHVLPPDDCVCVCPFTLLGCAVS
jgi:hypothetical protein